MIRFISCLLAILLVLTACGGGQDTGGDGADDNSEESVAASGDTGDEPSESDSADLGDFPIPAPPVGEAALSSDSGGVKVYTITFPADQYDTVVAFYDDWTNSQPGDYSRTEAESGGVSWLLDSETDAVIIAASPPLEGDDIAFVTLTSGEVG